MPKFRKKPVVIDAVQWTGSNAAELLQFSDCEVACALHEDRRVFEVPTLEGVMRGNIGDWLIRGVKGEYYPCKPDIFDATYEPA